MDLESKRGLSQLHAVLKNRPNELQSAYKLTMRSCSQEQGSYIYSFIFIIFVVFIMFRYKTAIDPTVECVKKLAQSLRRNAKEERVLFHFIGHGVPRPTEAGEIWVFNKNITQYIPLSLYDLQSWTGSPSVYIWDCHSAGTILNMFSRFEEQHRVSQLAGDPKVRLNDVCFSLCKLL